MKKFTLVLLIIHCSFFIADAQWLHQNPGTTVDLRSIRFINPYTGWACGSGTILKTTNGGNNWFAQNHPSTDKPLYKIQPIDSNVVYCVGWFQTILKTTNGGTNWLAIRNGPFGTGNSFFGMYFLNINTGWFTGASPYILKTTNGGNTFDSINIFPYGYIYDIYFKDSYIGLMSGEGGQIVKTTNGGSNWVMANINLHNQGYDFINMSIINNTNVWIIGRQVYNVYRSTDFGNNFDSIGNVNNGYEIYTVRFRNALTGWCGGGGMSTGGRMFLTTNGGVTWQRKDDSTNNGFISNIWFYNDTLGWTTGGNGIILKTTNGGISFVNQISTNVPDDFKLYQNYPNPFNQTTNIKYQISKTENRKWKTEKSSVSIKVFDILGREIVTLVNEKQSPGTYETRFDCRGLSTGIYFYSLFSDGYLIDTKKLVLLK